MGQEETDMFERQRNAWDDKAEKVTGNGLGMTAKAHADGRGMTVELVQPEGHNMITYLGDMFAGCLVSVDGEYRGKLSSDLYECPEVKGAGLHRVEYREP